MIWELDGIAPHIAMDAWVAPEAQVTGRVVIEAGASVWFGAVLRGDNEEIRLGRGSNIQDLCVCHTDPGYPLTVGENCTIGHRAILHGCTIGDGALIGMAATVMDGAVVEPGAMVAAGALVTPGKVVPRGELWGGSPARFLRRLTDEDRVRAEAGVKRYLMLAEDYRDV